MSNEITAYFKGRAGVSESLYQYDYGMVLNLDGIELPSSFECYFDTTGSDEAIPAIGTDSRVAIPNDCLSRPGDVTLHIPLHSGVNDSQVEYVVKFRVIGRARPVDGGTPEQQTAIEQALALLQNPITNIEQIVNEALDFTGDTFDEMQAKLDADQAAFQSDMGDRATTFENGIRSRQTQVESDFTNLNAQFQTAVSALTVDDELLNVRVGDDGVTYTSAGESVRTQFAKVKDSVDALYKKTDNLIRFDDPSFWQNKNFDGTSQPYLVTTVNKIPVTGGAELYTALTGLDQSVLGSSFRIIIRQYDNNDDAIGSDATFSTITSANPIHYTLNASTKKIVVMLTTIEWAKQISPQSLSEMNPRIYVGFNTAITNATAYRMYEPKVDFLKKDVDAIEANIDLIEQDQDICYKALSLEHDKEVVYEGKLSDTGTSSTKWFNIPINKQYKNFYFSYVDADGLDALADSAVTFVVGYSDSTALYKEAPSKNMIYQITPNPAKTVDHISIRITRGTVLNPTTSYVDAAIFGSNNYVGVHEAVKNNNLLYFEFDNIAFYAAGPSRQDGRISTGLFKTNEVLTISCDSGYEWGYNLYDDDEYNGFQSSGWKSAPLTFKTDKYISISLRKPNDSTIRPDEGIALHVSKAYDIGEFADVGYVGQKIDTQRHPIMVSTSELTREIPSGYVTQGGSIFGKYLVQGYAYSGGGDNDAIIQVFDLESNEMLYEQAISVMHFGSASFSNEYYSDDDPMPLLYVSGLNQHVFAVRVTESSATIIRDITLTIDRCGFYQGICVDAWKNWLYVFGYAIESYREVEGNYIKVTVYDLSQLSTADGVTTAEEIESYKLPFIYCYQDMEMYRGKIFIESGFDTSEHPTSILVYNPALKNIETTLTIGDIQNEPEMISFRSLDKKDVMYYQHHATKYTILDFI